MSTFEGKINKTGLAGCEVRVHQSGSSGLHVHLDHKDSCACNPTKPEHCDNLYYFSYSSDTGYLMETHRCAQNVNSTSQLWFGQL